MIIHMAHFNCVSSHPSLHTDNKLRLSLCFYLFSVSPPSLSSNLWLKHVTWMSSNVLSLSQSLSFISQPLA